MQLCNSQVKLIRAVMAQGGATTSNFSTLSCTLKLHSASITQLHQPWRLPVSKAEGPLGA